MTHIPHKVVFFLAIMFSIDCLGTELYAASCTEFVGAIVQDDSSKRIMTFERVGTKTYCGSLKKSLRATEILENYSADWLRKCRYMPRGKSLYTIIYKKGQSRQLGFLFNVFCQKQQ